MLKIKTAQGGFFIFVIWSRFERAKSAQNK
jgi:hypothetical protein